MLFSFILTVSYHYFAYIGHYGYDDMQYAKLANDLNHHIIDFGDHFSYRWPTIFMTALSYKVFGVCDFASSLPAIIITFSILTIVFLIIRKHNLFIICSGLALTILSQWSIFYSDKLMADIYVVFFILFSFFIIYHFKYVSDKKRPFLYAFLFALGMMFGFLSKEVILLTLPALIYLFITDIFLKRDIRFWIYSIIAGIIVLLIYFFIIWYLTGSPIKRFEAIFSNSYLNLCSYDKQPFEFLLNRISYEFFTMMINQGMLTGIIFVIAFMFQKNIKKTLQFSEPVSFFSISAILILFSSNFMSISFTSYVPMCLDVRHYLFIVPIAAIPASHIIWSFIEKKQCAIQIIAVLILFTLISYFSAVSSFIDLYLPMLALFAVAYILPTRYKLKYFFIVIFAVILMVMPFRMFQYAQQVRYDKQKKIVQDYFITNNSDCYVITDDVQIRLGIYYSGFNPNSRCTFLKMNEFNFDTLSSMKKKYLLLNGYTRYLSKLEDCDLPYYAKNIDSSNPLVFSDKDINLNIWELKTIGHQTVLLHSFNGFEDNVSLWEQNKENIRHDIKHKGSSSYFFNEFSATFKYSLDSIQSDSTSKVIINSNAWCLSNATTTAKLVVSIDRDGKSYIWQAIEINKFIKAFNNWCNVKFEVQVNSSEIQKNSVLKVYIWNPEKKELFVDDFDVEIIQVR